MIPIKGYATFDTLKHCWIGSGFKTKWFHNVNVDTIQHFLYRDFPDDLNTSELTNPQESYTIKELVEATKNIDPTIWKK